METNEQENTNSTAEKSAAERTTPAPEQDTTPAPEQDTTPAPEQDVAPAPEQDVAPAPEQEAAPAPEQEAASAPEQDAKPENDTQATDELPDKAADTAEVPPAAPTEPDWKEMYARTMADFDNFRKRTARDREELFKSAATDILKDLLPTVDNLALALDKAADKEDPFVKGVQLVYDGLVKMLADHGAVPVDSLGEPLDTNFHEAIATLPSPEVPEGHVMTEVKRGWLLNGKVLRAAQVVVSAGKGE